MERDFSDTTIGPLFKKIVEQFGREIAVFSNQEPVTYRQLQAYAGQIAGLLTASQGPDGTPVVLLVGHDGPAIAGLLGAIFAGRPYCFLARGSRRTEHEFIIQDLGAKVLLTDNAHQEQALALAGDELQVLNIEDIEPDSPSLLPAPGGAQDDPVAIYYTSGSTGRPKGVIRTHQSILGRLFVDNGIYQAASPDNIAGLRALNFGATSASVFQALLNGATLHLGDPQTMSTRELAEWLVQNRISILRLPTSLLRQMLEVLPADFCFDDLRHCRPSGRFLWADAQDLWRYLPHNCRMGHGLASTEGALITYWDIKRDQAPLGEVVPVGYPVPGVELRILDMDGQPVPHGQTGEIVISSPYVTVGYWGKNSQGAGKIQADPEAPNRRIMFTGDLGRLVGDGLLEFVGRKDNQVKVRGYRVELEVIEAALEQLPGVAEAAVRALAIDGGDNKLIGYVEGQNDAPLSTAGLRRRLVELLPEYMIPARLLQMRKLPRGATGKVNRAALPDPDRARPNLGVPFVAPRSEMEHQLTAIWRDLLDLEEVGVLDSFFDLGGQSLLAAGVASRIQSDLAIDIPLRLLYETATVAELAVALQTFAEKKVQEPEDDLQEKLRLLGL